MDNQKEAISPVYTTELPGDEICLYKGKMNLFCHDRVTSFGKGSVIVQWPSGCRIKYRFDGGDKGIYLENSPRTTEEDFIECHGIRVSAKVFISRYDGGNQSSFGQLSEPVVMGHSSQIKYVILHIVNFHNYIGEWIQAGSGGWAGRISLESKTWKVTIDSLPPKKSKNLFNSLRMQGGYAITHIARLERLSGETFSGEEVEDFLKALWYFLSFVRGAWVGIVLPVGFDCNNVKTWERWSSQKISSFTDVLSWFPKSDIRRNLNDMFTKFMELWKDDSQQEIIMLLIHWYVESNLQSGAVEGALLMAQAAFELLFEVTQNTEAVRLKADEKLRRLVTFANIPIKFSGFSFKEEWVHSIYVLTSASGSYMPHIPKAITETRNSLTHPKKSQNGLRLPANPLKIEAWRISIWYLELLLLHFLDYKGLYSNRVRVVYEGDYDQVPWTSNSD